jgi:hypothetical protein
MISLPGLLHEAGLSPHPSQRLGIRIAKWTPTRWPEPNLELLNYALEQTDWEGPPLDAASRGAA